MGDEYAECQKLHAHIGGKSDGWQQFKERYSSLPTPTLICKICGCHRDYHRKVVYSNCNKIHDFKIPNSVDGCQEFIPFPGDFYKKLTCGACGCHRNFHRKEVRTKEVVSTACGGGVPFEVKKETLS